MDDHKLDNTGKKSSALARGGKKSGQWLLAHPLGALQLLGLVLLVASSRLLVWGAVSIAEGLGVSEYDVRVEAGKLAPGTYLVRLVTEAGVTSTPMTVVR